MVISSHPIVSMLLDQGMSPSRLCEDMADFYRKQTYQTDQSQTGLIERLQLLEQTCSEAAKSFRKVNI